MGLKKGWKRGFPLPRYSITEFYLYLINPIRAGGGGHIYPPLVFFTLILVV